MLYKSYLYDYCDIVTTINSNSSCVSYVDGIKQLDNKDLIYKIVSKYS
jgi:hypothetical protein